METSTTSSPGLFECSILDIGHIVCRRAYERGFLPSDLQFHDLPRPVTKYRFHVQMCIFCSDVCVGEVCEAESAFKIIKHSFIVSHYLRCIFSR